MIFLLTIGSFAFFSLRRLLTYIHIFQQDDYNTARFLKWIINRRAFDKRLTFFLLVTAFACLVVDQYAWFFQTLAIPLFLIFALLEKDPRYHAKKRLILTDRAKRIFFLSLFLSVVSGLIYIPVKSLIIWIVLVQFLPVFLVIANGLLQPVEILIQQRYWDEAHSKVLECKPFTIGITGSYGKTSLKHVLGHILETAFPTLITPGSVNTPMGISRIIREQLTDGHKYFLVEMGAYGKGSIKRICRLTPPDMGVITSIGHAHYERFKSLEIVAKTKFELADAVCKKNGKIVTHADVISLPYTRSFARAYPENFIVCDKKDGSFTIGNIRQNREGLSVDVIWRGKKYSLEASLYGKNHGKNMALAFAAACTLGISPEIAKIALKSTPQIAHRLEVQSQANNIVVIDDAYNSNPEGFLDGLELLETIKTPEGRRILVTPGMVELGSAHNAEHAKLGKKAAQYSDIVLAIIPKRIKTFIESFKENATPYQKFVFCKTNDDAQTWLAQNIRPGDVILFENSLPDLYESHLKL